MRRLLLLALALLTPQCRAQFVVVALTPDLNTITIENHLEEMNKLDVLIDHAMTTKDWLGNAADILDIAGANDVLGDLETPSVGRSRLDLATTATSQEAVSYDGAGLYQSVGDSFLTRDGRTVQRAEVFKPEAAVFNAVLNHDAVHDDVMVRREKLRFTLQQTLTQLQAATTHTEVQKAIGVLIAQHAALDATDRELQFALEKVQFLDIQNRTERERQEKASRQEQSEEFRESLRSFTEMLRPPNFTPSSKPATDRK